MSDFKNGSGGRGDYIEGKLEALLALRQQQGNEAGEEQRDLFLFCLYNSVARGGSHEEAMKRVEEFNERFLDPMDPEEIASYLRTSEQKRYQLKNATIIEKLGITPEEQVAIDFYPAGQKPGTKEYERREARDKKADRDAEILRQYKQGIRQNEIAKAVGCSAQTVGRVLQKNGHASRSEQLHAQILELMKRGVSAPEISEALGVTRSSVYDHIRRARADGEI